MVSKMERDNVDVDTTVKAELKLEYEGYGKPETHLAWVCVVCW